MWLAWHIGGMGWSEYLELPSSERRAIERALSDRISEYNETATAMTRQERKEL